MVEDWFALVRRAAPYAALPRSAFDSVLDLISGRYPSAEFSALRPRVVWDREAGTLSARPGAQRLAVTSGGTIPDRGLFRVVTSGEDDARTRIGELDEEMVYESRVGDVIILGASGWRIRDIGPDVVEVVPAPGVPGRMPFWRGESAARPAELGRAMGESIDRWTAAAPDDRDEDLARIGLDPWARANLARLLAEQRDQAGAVSGERTIVVERTRDELGDWRLVVQSPHGLAVHAPWALAIEARIRELRGLHGTTKPFDDGLVIRLPDTEAQPPGAELLLFEPGELRRTVIDEVSGSALFAARFRECAARSLILGSSTPGRRSPLWQQRQRSARLLEVASRHADFPVVLEAVRECLSDVYDLDALDRVHDRLVSGAVSLRQVTTEFPSPFARAMLFGYIGEFLYEGDAPMSERRLAALSIDPALLRELLGEIELRELLEPRAVDEVTAELQRLAPHRRLRGIEGAADLLRLLGPLSAEQVGQRLRSEEADEDPEAEPSALGTERAREHLESLVADRRAYALRMGGHPRFARIEDAGLLRDALGAPLPRGLPAAFAEPVPLALDDLVLRLAQVRGSFTDSGVAAELGLNPAALSGPLKRLEGAGALLAGRFGLDSEGSAGEWVHREVLARLRTRSLAILRGSIEPVAPAVFAGFLADWHRLGQGRGEEGVLDAVAQLSGCPLPASAIETHILPARVRDYRPEMLDALLARGIVSWRGHGRLSASDGWVSLQLRDDEHLLEAPAELDAGEDTHHRILALLAERGAAFASVLRSDLSATAEDAATGDFDQALWDLAWAGHLSSDSLAPVRARVQGRRGTQRSRPAPRRATSHRRGALAALRGRSAATVVREDQDSRWSRTPAAEHTARIAGERTAQLLDRHGILTRGGLAAERFPGGFQAAYAVLGMLEESGHCRRGHFVAGLGGAQFAVPGAADRLREVADELQAAADREAHTGVVLAAGDPAQPYGAALAWPETTAGQRPRRAAGALVVIVDGHPVLHLERGGRSGSSFAGDTDSRGRAGARALVEALRSRPTAELRLETLDAGPVRESRWCRRLLDAGFEEVPQGIVLRAPR